MGLVITVRGFARLGVRKVARDFFAALIAISALFVMLSPTEITQVPVPVLSLFNLPGAAEAHNVRGLWSGAVNHNSFMRSPLPAANVPLISSLLSVLFASLVAFNLALFRHLRRVNASSRRSVWKEG